MMESKIDYWRSSLSEMHDQAKERYENLDRATQEAKRDLERIDAALDQIGRKRKVGRPKKTA